MIFLFASVFSSFGKIENEIIFFAAAAAVINENWLIWWLWKKTEVEWLAISVRLASDKRVVWNAMCQWWSFNRSMNMASFVAFISCCSWEYGFIMDELSLYFSSIKYFMHLPLIWLYLRSIISRNRINDSNEINSRKWNFHFSVFLGNFPVGSVFVSFKCERNHRRRAHFVEFNACKINALRRNTKQHKSIVNILNFIERWMISIYFSVVHKWRGFLHIWCEFNVSPLKRLQNAFQAHIFVISKSRSGTTTTKSDVGQKATR